MLRHRVGGIRSLGRIGRLSLDGKGVRVLDDFHETVRVIDTGAPCFLLLTLAFSLFAQGELPVPALPASGRSSSPSSLLA